MEEGKAGDVVVAGLAKQLGVCKIREVVRRADNVEEATDFIGSCLLDLPFRRGWVVVDVLFDDPAKTVVIALVIEWRCLAADWLTVSV